jgi:hypothetical protein
MSNFQEILNKPSTSIEKPKPVPVGTYLGLVTGQPRFDKSKQKQTDFVEYTVKLLQPREDVNQDDLLAMGGLDGKTMRLTYYITDDATWRLKQFLVEHLGIEEGSKTLGQMIPEAMGKQVYVTVSHQASQDGTAVYANASGTAKV